RCPQQLGKEPFRLLRVVATLGELVDVEQHRAHHVEEPVGLAAGAVGDHHVERTEHRGQGGVLVADDLEGGRLHGATPVHAVWLTVARGRGRRLDPDQAPGYTSTMSYCSWLYIDSTCREIGLPIASPSIARCWLSSSRKRSITGLEARMRNSRGLNCRASRATSRMIS